MTHTHARMLSRVGLLESQGLRLCGDNDAATTVNTRAVQYLLPFDTAPASPTSADGTPSALRARAEALFELGLSTELRTPGHAMLHYLGALAANPGHVEAMLNLGRLWADAGDLPRAALLFRRAVSAAPQHPVAHFNLAVCLHDLGDREAARVSYQQALRHDPNLADAHFNLATLLEEAGQNAAALQHLAAYRALTASAEP